jgi:hypothetical protein
MRNNDDDDDAVSDGFGGRMVGWPSLHGALNCINVYAISLLSVLNCSSKMIFESLAHFLL